MSQGSWPEALERGEHQGFGLRIVDGGDLDVADTRRVVLALVGTAARNRARLVGDHHLVVARDGHARALLHGEDLGTVQEADRWRRRLQVPWPAEFWIRDHPPATASLIQPDHPGLGCAHELARGAVLLRVL